MNRKALFLGPAAGLVLLALTLYLGRDHLRRLPRPAFLTPWQPDAAAGGEALPPNIDSPLPWANVTAYVDAILDVDATDMPHMSCPSLDESRYAHLQSYPASTQSPQPIQYFFALDLRNVVDLLPRLIGSVVQTIRFLGPKRCALSIVEGNSPDGTGAVLAALRPALDALTTTYYFKTSDINPLDGDRIVGLAALRNLALQPLFDPLESRYYSAANTTVAFLNDVAACPEDILELLHQRRQLSADMVCAFDWTWVNPDPSFYDVWVARAMSGDSFFDIPPDGSWSEAHDLFRHDPEAKVRFALHRPFQVYTCWNGATAFAAGPVMRVEDGGRGIQFRGAREGECYQGEPQLFCKDLWLNGYGKIAVVPSVNLEYSNEKGQIIKDLKGYTSQLVGSQNDPEDLIEWQADPPETVRCMLGWANQFMEPWNVSAGTETAS